jgi:hypothetical protein
MRKAGLQLLEAFMGIFLGMIAASTLQLALHKPLAAQELPRLADHPCRAGTQQPPYLHGDVVTLGGTAYVCNGFDGSWRRRPSSAERRMRTIGF